MNELGIILHNQTIWIGKPELLTIGGLAFAIYFLISVAQLLKGNKKSMRPTPLIEIVKINLVTIGTIYFALYLSFTLTQN